MNRIGASGRPDSGLTPDREEGQDRNPYDTYGELPDWRRRPWPRVGWWSNFTGPPVRPQGVYQ